MSHIIDETNKTYGKLTVKSYSGSTKDGQAIWKCECQCGREAIVRGAVLRNGSTKTCGICEKKARMESLNKTHGMANKTPIYRIWRAMRSRCYYPKNKAYKYYGARGITVCDEWKNNYLTFHNWAVKNGYFKGMTIERIDVNLAYCPENCTLIPFSEQNKNKRNTVFMTWKGETKTMLEWAEDERVKKQNITYRMIKRRKGLGWSTHKMLTTPPKANGRNWYLTYNGKTKSLKEWSKESGIRYETLIYRIDKLKWDPQKALTTPIHI
jgi:hypothetical protein